MNIVTLITCFIMVLIILLKLHHDIKNQTNSRSGMLDDCSKLLSNMQKHLDKAKLPIIKGVFDGYNVSLNIVEDTLGWRKIPPLWLLVKVNAKVTGKGSLDYIVRPSNSEFYSPSWQWNGNSNVPDEWPQHAILKYQHQIIDLSLVNQFIPALFKDSNMKELLLTPNMTRLTYMVKQADRGEYLIMRNAIYEKKPIAIEIVESLLKQAVSIQKNIENNENSQFMKAA